MGREFDYSRYPHWIDPAEAVPYEGNAKIHTDKQVANIANSISRFGWRQECVITRDGVIVIGHGRRLAAMKLGCKMPVQVIDADAESLTEDDIRELRTADNLTNAETGFDFEKLGEEMGELDFAGFEFDLSQFGMWDSGADQFEAFDGEGDGGGSQLSNGTKVRVVIGALMFDLDDPTHEIYAKTKKADAETVKAALSQYIADGDLM